MTHLTRVGPSLVVAVAFTCACGRSEESRHQGAETGATDSAAAAASAASSVARRVSNVMIGRQVGPKDRVTDPTFQFTPHDTVYVSVATEGGGGGGTLSAAWRSQNGEILQQTSAPVPPAGENAAFRLSRPEGLKPGTYKVIVFLNEDSVETKVFAVKK
jgi:hypothetical protein